MDKLLNVKLSEPRRHFHDRPSDLQDDALAARLSAAE